jgi:CDP-glucose 4,6-dehydratase
MGSLRLYEACRNSNSVKAIISATTDKVYENYEWPWGYRESDRLGGRDPYSASKAAAEIMTQSYVKSFFNIDSYEKEHNILVATVRAGNVIGGGDWSEDRLVPDAMRATKDSRKVKIRNPGAVRPWQHVLEPLSGYLLVGQKLLEKKKELAQAYNFGPAFEENLKVKDVLAKMQSAWDRIEFNVEKESGAPHEAGVLRLDCSKASLLLDWKPVWSIDSCIEKTVLWYRSYYENESLKTKSDILEYVNCARDKNAVWA